MRQSSEHPVRSRGEIINHIQELIKWLDGHGRVFKTQKGGTWIIGKPIRRAVYTPFDFSVPHLERFVEVLHNTQTDVCLGLIVPMGAVGKRQPKYPIDKQAIYDAFAELAKNACPLI